MRQRTTAIPSAYKPETTTSSSTTSSHTLDNARRRRFAGRDPLSSVSSGHASSSWEITTESYHHHHHHHLMPSRGVSRRNTGGSAASSSSSTGSIKSIYQNTATSAYSGGMSTSPTPTSPGQRPVKLGEPQAPPLREFHVMYRNALHVPDNRYQEYLAIQQGLPPKGGAAGPALSKRCCAGTCFGFSLVAIVFLVFIGVLIDNQPIMIGGILEAQTTEVENEQTGQRRPVVQYLVPKGGERLPTATTAYRAAIAYVVCAAFCFYVLHPQYFTWITAPINRQWRRTTSQSRLSIPQRHQYQDLDSAAAVSGTGVGLPLYQVDDEDMEGTGDADEPSAVDVVWNRVSVMGSQWLSERGLYQPAPAGRRRQKNTKKTG